MNDNEKFDDFDDLDEDCRIIYMNDEDGVKKEYMLIDSIVCNDINYLLVVDNDFIDDEEAEAVILKEMKQEGEDFIYEIVDQDAEFEKIASLFQNSNEDYDIEL